VAPAKTAPADKRAAKHEPSVTPAKVSKLPAPASVADTGDVDFRKGEAYLYGRGAPENCGEAVKNLKAASAKSNAKARSAFGTMYATGHCVPRDLPTSYLWFALALRVDPNNQILEKDLSAVWNQMTPPERQMASRMKQ
jgi:TPR repeat protein